MRKLKEGKKAKSLADELIDMTLPYKNYIKTITADNGNEFSDFKRIEKNLNLQIFSLLILIVLGSEVLVNTLMVLCVNTYQKIHDFKDITDKKLENINIKLIIDQEKY